MRVNHEPKVTRNWNPQNEPLIPGKNEIFSKQPGEYDRYDTHCTALRRFQSYIDK